jgi:hypothetical protein
VWVALTDLRIKTGEVTLTIPKLRNAYDADAMEVGVYGGAVDEWTQHSAMTVVLMFRLTQGLCVGSEEGCEELLRLHNARL